MDDAAWRSLYRMMKASGLPKPTPMVEVRNPGNNHFIATITLACPESKVGLLVADTVPPALARAGWTVTAVRPRDLEAATALLAGIDSIHYAHVIAASQAGAKLTTSKTEQRLLNEMVRAGLPVGDRNLQFCDDDGFIVTVPDFSWVEAKLAVFVDGWRWHGGLDLENEIKDLAAGDTDRSNQFARYARDKAAKDLAARSHLTRLGWAHMAIADRDIDNGLSATFAAAVRDVYRERIALKAGT